MTKFKMGDKVKGNKGATRYIVTIPGWIGIVTKLEEEYFRTKEGFNLHYDNFDLIERDGRAYTPESNDYPIF